MRVGPATWPLPAGLGEQWTTNAGRIALSIRLVFAIINSAVSGLVFALSSPSLDGRGLGGVGEAAN